MLGSLKAQTDESQYRFSFDASVNNGLDFSYVPPNLTWTPYSIINPVGIHNKSLFGFNVSSNYYFELKKNLYISLGFEFQYISKNTFLDADSTNTYYDTTGILLYYNQLYRQKTLQIPILVEYRIKSLFVSVGLSVPIYLINNYSYSNILESRSYLNQVWFWDMKFPSVLIEGRLGWAFNARYNLFVEYARYSNRNFLEMNLYSLGIRYRFNIK